ncbi:MAG: cytochrome c biogenesis protein CcdA [Caldilineales bacterium]|nr:cytochrome c biogenesis protein CcdA [Caldilineales bacterium]MDW8316637.1 cytochrome c biogenesis protein CcdA [Anaerolineae bacterium]
MDAQNLNLLLASTFGLVSFFSPCVLPLVPVYLGYLSGAALAGADDRGQVPRGQVVAHAAVLVLGFSVVFIALGALGGGLGYLLSQATPSIVRVGGVLLAVFGLRVAHLRWPRWAWLVLAVGLGLLAWLINVRETAVNRLLQAALFAAVGLAGMAWPLAGHVALGGAAALLNFLSTWSGSAALLGVPDLGGFSSTLTAIAESGLIWLLVAWASRTDLFYAEKRFDLGTPRRTGYGTSLLVGMVFAAGWTPCVGPILASILVLAASEQSVGRGALLLTFYSIGLGVPFLLAGLLFGNLASLLPKISRHLPTITAVSGLLLAAVGVLIYNNGLQLLASMVPQVELETWLLGVLGMQE